ncbi:hypothetical protein, partial [Klebsiella pneumoniae]|uniref:hypothetical protein n=1 Tax=Klebsiella pneumoniae TaxID=573 RepID=UPI0039C16AB3
STSQFWFSQVPNEVTSTVQKAPSILHKHPITTPRKTSDCLPITLVLSYLELWLLFINFS